MVNIQKVLVRGMCPIGYRPSENASTWYICKIFRVQWLRTHWHIPFKIRGSTTKKKRRITMPNVISHIEHSSSPYSRQHERLPGLSGFKLWLRKDCSSFRWGTKNLATTWTIRSTGSTVPEASVMWKEAQWCLCRVPLRKSQQFSWISGARPCHLQQSVKHVQNNSWHGTRPW